MNTKMKGFAETIHENTSCDVCKKDPIKGNRYKCSVCENFDLCDSCFLNRKHSEHPLIKLKDLKYDFKQENFD